MRICLVGPAPHITEIDQKDYINGFDLVARTSWALPLSEEVKKTTGDRCDIYYTHHIWGKEEPELEKVKEIRERSDAKWLSDKHREKVGVIPIELLNRLKIEIGYSGTRTITSGYVAIHDLLSRKPDELYITGFTFYKTGYYKGYGPEQTNVLGKTKSAGHDPDKEFKHFIQHVFPLKNIKCDDTLRSLIK